LPNEHKVLSCFDTLEDLTEQIGGTDQTACAVKSSQLELGPLAELLVIRSRWRAQGRALRLDGAGDARHAAIRAVSAAPGPARLGREAGAIQIRGTGEAVDLAGHEFALAVGRYAQEAGMPNGASRLLKGAFAELIGNVSEHAGDNANGIAAYGLRSNEMWLAVADTGQGVVRGYLASAPDLAGLDAATALGWAVVEHRSRFRESGRGTGFSTVMRAMLTLDAALRVRSDDASIEIEGASSGANWVIRDQDSLGGFVVSLHVRWH
jgi:anti-sigma regulatory factor (Ser/Thr protein kinase)